MVTILKNRKNAFLGVISLVVFIIILLAGLWPLSFRLVNEVNWLLDRNGISFYGHGIAYSSDPLIFSSENPCLGNSISIELWLQSKVKPARHLNHFNKTRWHYAQILSLYNNKLEELSIGEQKSRLIIRNRPGNKKNVKHYKEISVDNALPFAITRLITIISNEIGTHIYIDGKLAKSFKNHPLIKKNTGISGRLLIGNSPFAKDPWTGNLFGIAIYNRALTKDEVLEHYNSWLQQGISTPSVKKETVALYLFNEHRGISAHNNVGKQNDLLIPKYFQEQEKKRVLAPPGEAFWRGRINRKDILVNIFGFIPFGLFFSAFLYNLKRFSNRQIYLVAMLLGGAISLTIELLQVYIPLRDSALIDLLCNISGTAIGTILFQILFLFYLKRSEHSRQP